MNQLDKKISNIQCFEDFEKIFYPKSYKEKAMSFIDDPKKIAAKLADESLKEVKHTINKE